ncbi:hypothetical protein WDW86_08755 [Bdellovibrionota bacterium FG-2]
MRLTFHAPVQPQRAIETTRPEAELIKACGGTSEHVKILTPTPGFVVQTPSSILHCSLPTGALIQNYSIPAQGSATLNQSKNFIILGKTAQESYALDFDNLINPVKKFPKEANLSQGNFDIVNGNFFQYTAVSGYKDTLWVNDREYIFPYPLYHSKPNGNFSLDDKARPPVLYQIEKACFTGSLQIADETPLKKPDCANQSVTTKGQTPLSSSESILHGCFADIHPKIRTG